MGFEEKELAELGFWFMVIIIAAFVILMYPLFYAVSLSTTQTCIIEFSGEVDIPILNNTYVKGSASIVMPCKRMIEMLEES